MKSQKTILMTIAKIVSGGQTGIDRGALAAYPPLAGVRDPWGSEHAERSECRALKLGFPYSGMIPKGRNLKGDPI